MFNGPHLDQSLFRLALQDIAAGASVQAQGDELIVGARSDTELSAEQMAHVLGFVRAHAEYLEADDAGTLDQLQARLSQSVGGKTRSEISGLFQALHNYDGSKVAAKLPELPNELASTCSKLELRHSATLMCALLTKAVEQPWLCVTEGLSVTFEPPLDWDAQRVVKALKEARASLGRESEPLTEVLDALITRYADPKVLLLMQLLPALHDPMLTVNADLTVSQQKPADWDRSAVLTALKAARSELNAELPELGQLLDRLIEDHQPARMVKLGMCIVDRVGGDSNGAVAMTMENWLYSGLPLLTTKALVGGNAGDFSGTVYAQRSGGLVLYVPRGVEAEALGINLNEFSVVKAGDRVAYEPFDHQQDLQKAFQKGGEQEAPERLIVAIGHGSPAKMGEARICGLPATHFQEMLGVLAENKLAFLTLISCFSGGENLSDLRIPTGQVPCPILLWNATESVALGEPETLKVAKDLLEHAGSKLFAALPSGRTPRVAHLLKRTELREIGKPLIRVPSDKMPLELTETFNLQNLQSLLFPSQRADVPRVAYLGAAPESVLDLDDAIRQQLRQGRASSEGIVELTVDSDRVRTLFCSGPRHPARVHIRGKSSSIGVLARGGNSVHFIEELDMPAVSLDRFVLEAANKVMRISHGVPSRLLGANVLFHINKLTCKDDQDNPQQLHDVVISLTTHQPELNYTAADGKRYRRKIVLDMAQIALFSMPKSALAVQPESLVENDRAFLFRRFEQLLRCRPSEGQLRASIAGQISFRALCDDFAERAHAGLNRKDLKLCQLALEPHKLKRLLEKIQKLHGTDKAEAIDRVLSLCISADNDAAVEALLQAYGPWDREIVDGKTALHLAAERGALAVTKRLLAGSKNPDQQDATGRTALHYAVIEYHPRIAQLLATRCSDMVQDITERSPLDYALLSHREPLVRSFLANSSGPITSEESRTSLLPLVADEETMRALIESKRIPLHEPYLDNASFLECCLKTGLSANALSLLLTTDYAEAESAQQVFVRLLRENQSFGHEQLALLSEAFPLSEQDKLLISTRWLAEQHKEHRSYWRLEHMRTLGINPKPEKDWQQLLTNILADSHTNHARLAAYLELGIKIDWQALGQQLAAGGPRLYNLSSATLAHLKEVRPDLSNDDNWLQLYKACEKYHKDLAELLLDCGVRPEPPVETQGMSSDELFTWLTENRKRIRDFDLCLQAGFTIEPDSSAARTALALLLGQKSRTAQYRRVRRVIDKLMELGVQYDPKHEGISAEDWKAFDAEPSVAQLNALQLDPAMTSRSQLLAELDIQLGKGTLPVRIVNQLIHLKAPLNYAVLPEEIFEELILGNSGFLAWLEEVGVRISDALATSVFSKLLTTKSFMATSTLLHQLLRYQIHNKEQLLADAIERFIDSVPQGSFVSGTELKLLSLLIELGAPVLWTDALIQLLEKDSSGAIFAQLSTQLPKKVEATQVISVLGDGYWRTELLRRLIDCGAIAADDPGLKKLRPYELSSLEPSLYERGVRPSEEECLQRYWSGRAGKLHDLIRRDLNPDPSSELALEALSKALQSGSVARASQLLDLGVPFNASEELVAPVRKLFDGYMSHETVALLEKLVAAGLDPAVLKEGVRKRVEAAVQNGRNGIIQLDSLKNLLHYAAPFTFKSPAPAVAYELSRGSDYSNDLALLVELGYDMSPHRAEIANNLAHARYSKYSAADDEIRLLRLCPSVTDSDLLPMWLQDDMPIALLQEVAAAGADRQQLSSHITRCFASILERLKSYKELAFVARYVDPELWKDEQAVKTLNTLINDEANSLQDFLRFAQKHKLLEALKPKLSSCYRNCLIRASQLNIEGVQALIDAEVPIPKGDKAQVLQVLYKYDLLKLANTIKGLPEL